MTLVELHAKFEELSDRYEANPDSYRGSESEYQSRFMHFTHMEEEELC